MTPTDDLVLRLRSHAYSRDRQDAADEIERLRDRNRELEQAFREFVTAQEGLRVPDGGRPYKVLMADFDAARRFYDNAKERLSALVEGVSE